MCYITEKSPQLLHVGNKLYIFFVFFLAVRSMGEQCNSRSGFGHIFHTQEGVVNNR